MPAASIFYRLLADLIVLLHVTFVVFAVFGGILVARWRRVTPFHIAAVVWAALIEFSGWLCPLTPLENWLRKKSAGAVYHSDFVAHYILPILYPEGLTREAQIVLGILVILFNLGIYRWAFRRKRRRSAR